VDAELKNKDLPEKEQIHLGLLQTPQCFYDPDVFQHALYSEKRAPNEQDFFYRTIEPAKTSTNSVIYGGSNTVLSRAALDKIGGFYTESITEDFAAFAIPVFKCNWLELLVFWLPMFIMQDVNLQVCSKRTISQKWSGIYETGVMPHLLIPIIKESMGISLSTFKVTDKSGKKAEHESDVRSMIPFILLILLSAAGIVRIIYIFNSMQAIGLCILLFWIIRNLYYLILSVFLVDDRDSDIEPVKVMDAVPVSVTDKTDKSGNREYEGVTTLPQSLHHDFGILTHLWQNIAQNRPNREVEFLHQASRS